MPGWMQLVRYIYRTYTWERCGGERSQASRHTLRSWRGAYIDMGKMRWKKKSSQSPHLKKLAWGLHRHGKDAVEKEVKPVATP